MNYIKYIKKLFSGRIGRKNYGLGLLFFIGSVYLLILLIAILASMFLSEDSSFGFFVIVVLYVALYVAFIVHIFSLHARRFHDLGDSAWRVLLFFIPLVNLIIIISLLTTKGKDEANKYGEVPSRSIKFFDAIFNRNENIFSTTDNQIINKGSQYCGKCGAQIESSSKFCYKCGAKVIALKK